MSGVQTKEEDKNRRSNNRELENKIKISQTWRYSHTEKMNILNSLEIMSFHLEILNTYTRIYRS
jgi:hypothetical protein